MSDNNTQERIKNLIGMILGVFTFMSIVQSFFDDDSGKIVTKRGEKVLMNKDKMNSLNDMLLKAEDSRNVNEIIL